ncbi:TIGR02281 family clan AA aspartic protease [Ochrobactrum pecoris]|uniref:Aspartyl protease family protein n=1 Tax=Brucella pecoris TaxID=867683 RepID=A0A5C5CIF5_9HYPH|nr:TIGR02281 family clan AA aspartic protease [Brucella pecoris]MBB4095046.1 aspartyl protease family protein [Brucella pecoris]NKW79664.1 TIGR02281 family clan AA aspartic protease [Brucella pecoris]TNV10901.1 TIGR02281 family clan AA aspartic protease [Brucella pecoris]
MARVFTILLVFAGLAIAFPLLFEKFGQGPKAVSNTSATASTVPSQNATAYSGRRTQIAPDSRGHFITDIKVAGQSLRAMVDTGASVVAINASAARRVGLSLKPADFKYRVSTANGETIAASATLPSIEIGRVRLENVEAMVLRDDALSDTLLGMSFLKRLRHYEVSNGTLVLTQ